MATNLDSLFEQFLRERKYLRNVSSDTIEWYRTAWKAFCSATSCLPDPSGLNRVHVEQFVYALRDRGVRPTWLRALNAFFTWLHENGHIAARVHMKPLKVEKRLVQTLDEETIRSIVQFKLPMAVTVNKNHIDGPRKGQKAFAWWRVHALACALLDNRYGFVDASRDGRELLVARPISEAGPRAPLNVLLNWQQDSRRAPTRR